MGNVPMGAESHDEIYKECGGEELAEEVHRLVLYGGHGAESAEHGVGLVRRGGIMVNIESIYENGAGEAPEHLGAHVGKHEVPGEETSEGQAERYRRIQVGAAVRPGNENACHYRKPPPHGDHYPSCSLGLAPVERAGCAHTVSEKYEHEGAQKLEDTFHKQRNFHIDKLLFDFAFP